MNIKKTIFYLSALLLLVSVGLALFMPAAGSSPREAVGKNLSPRGETQIELAKEQVDIKLNPGMANVRATFYLKNPGNRTEVEAGIPLGGEARPEEFEAWVNGQPVEVKEGPDRSGEFAGWKYWKLSFEPNETKIVKIGYMLTLEKVPFIDWLPETRHSLSYALKTGRDWKGKTAAIDVQVELKDVDPQMLVSVSPSGYDLKDNTISWDLDAGQMGEGLNLSFNEKLFRYDQALPLPLAVKWESNILGEPQSSYLAAGTGDTLLIASNYRRGEGRSGSLRAVDLQTGQVKWQSEDLPEVFDAPFSGETLVIIETRGGLRAIDPKKARLKWSYDIAPLETGDGGSARLLASSGSVYYLSSDRQVRAVDLKTGKLRWQAGLPESATDIFPELDLAGLDAERLYITGSSPYSSPAKVWAVRLENGQIGWMQEVAGISHLKGTDQDGRLFLAGAAVPDGSAGPAAPTGSKVVVLEAASGQKIWEKKLADPQGKIVLSAGGGKVFAAGTGSPYIFGDPKQLWALDADNGQVVWQKETGGALLLSPVYSGGTVYLGTADGYLLAFDSANGDLKWRYQNRGYGDYLDFRFLHISDQVRYFGLGRSPADRGTVYAFEPTGSNGALTDPPVVYKVIAGTFSERTEAESQSRKIEQTGTETWVEPANSYGNLWTVTAGRWKSEAGAGKVVSRLKAKGFKASYKQVYPLEVPKININGRYTVLAARSTTLGETIGLAEKALNAGVRAWIEPYRSNAWQVIAGRTDDLSEAIALTGKLTAAGFTTTMEKAKNPGKTDQGRARPFTAGNDKLTSNVLYVLALSLSLVGVAVAVYAFLRPEKQQQKVAVRVAGRAARQKIKAETEGKAEKKKRS